MESIQNNVFTQEQLQHISQELAEVMKPVKDFMTVDGLAEYMELSKSAIYKLTSSRQLPHYAPGGKKIYFKREEVNAWIVSGRVASDCEVLESLDQSSIPSNISGQW